jgi:hypothetical protein
MTSGNQALAYSRMIRSQLLLPLLQYLHRLGVLRDEVE